MYYLQVCRIIVAHECTQTHTHTHTHPHPHLVGFLWTRDRTVAETSTVQHTTPTRKRYPCYQGDLNSQFQQSEPLHTYALDRAATGTGPQCIISVCPKYESQCKMSNVQVSHFWQACLRRLVERVLCRKTTCFDEMFVLSVVRSP
jgi:hypothetical protein